MKNLTKASLMSVGAMTLLSLGMSLGVSANVHHTKQAPGKVMNYSKSNPVQYYKKNKQGIRLYTNRGLKSYVINKNISSFKSTGNLHIRFHNGKNGVYRYVKSNNGKIRGYVYSGLLSKKEANKNNESNAVLKKDTPKKTDSWMQRRATSLSTGKLTPVDKSTLPKKQLLDKMMSNDRMVYDYVEPLDFAVSNTHFRGNMKKMATLRDKMNAWGRVINEGKAGITNKADYLDALFFIKNDLLDKKTSVGQDNITQGIKYINKCLTPKRLSE